MTLLGDPIVALCYGDPVALNLPVPLLPMLQKFTEEVGVVVGYVTVLVLDLGDS